MNLEQRLRSADRQAVAFALPAGSALVEFVHCPIFDFDAVPAKGEAQWRKPRYIAFVLPAGESDNVRLIDLGEAASLDALIATFRASITGDADGRGRAGQPDGSIAPARRPDEDAGMALSRTLVDPLIAALGGRTRLFLAPDGELTRLPFEVVPLSDQSDLVERYQISYLGAGRDVLRFGVTASAAAGAPVVIADPDFDLAVEVPPTTVSATASAADGARAAKAGRLLRLFGRRPANAEDRPAAAPEHPPASATGAHAVAGRSPAELRGGAVHFDRLPGTQVEGERIAALLDVSPWLSGAALEAAIKECRSPAILHLATHGLFLPDRPHNPEVGGRTNGLAIAGVDDELGRLAVGRLQNPLLRSGLALAGANTWCRGGAPPEQAEDGILTAEDVSGLDLLGTELVVLSACETGLGDVRTGEGVFGLRRAFVLAGARSLIVSLWKVPDEPTQELMTDFYSRLLAGRPRADALREAQLALRQRYPDPICWGAFICLGDPGTLGREMQRATSTARERRAPGHPADER